MTKVEETRAAVYAAMSIEASAYYRYLREGGNKEEWRSTYDAIAPALAAFEAAVRREEREQVYTEIHDDR